MYTRPLLTLGLALALTAPALAGPAGSAALASKDPIQVRTALSGTGAATQETNLGDLVADALRDTGRAQAALLPADELNSSTQIPAGKTDSAAILAALRYGDDPGDTVVVLNLTGAQLLKVAERSVSRLPEPFDGFLQVSGLQIRYAPGQPSGKRVSLVGLSGGEVVASQTYRIATTRSLAGGSLGYFQIFDKKDISEDTGVPLSQSLASYLSAHKTLDVKTEGRITSQ